MPADQPLEELALLRALADDARLALAGMHVAVGARDVDVAADHELAAFGMQARSPIGKARHEFQLGRVTFAAVGLVVRREHAVADLRLDDALAYSRIQR